MGQPSDAKCRASTNNNNNQSSTKRQRAEAHNADAEETSHTANVAIEDKSVMYHVAKDGLIDVVDENNMSPETKNKVIHELYDWLADTSTMSHITHQQDTFATYELVPKIPVNLAGKNRSFAIAKGTIFLQSECEGIIHTLQLNNVLHIPNTDHSLLSLSCWEQTDGRKIQIQYGKITLLTEAGIAVARGIRLSNRLYQMSFVISHVPADANFAFHTRIYQLSWETWH